MVRFRKLSHTIWFCQYHIVWTPTYRFRILRGRLVAEVESCIRAFCQHQRAEVLELSIPLDHVHLLVVVPPKISISNFVGTAKGRTAIRVLNKFKQLKQKPYWGNHFWARGYCVDTVGLDSEKIRKYVKYQEEREKKYEQ
jgi:putative transposase